MANNQDIFAAPTADEVRATMGAPKSAGADLFAPPTSQEHQAVLGATQASDGSTPDAPISKDLFGDYGRTAGSFGDDGGKAKMLAGQGYVSAKRNGAGDQVFQHADGKWYKDADNFFSGAKGLEGYVPEHPLNWAESKLGKALPMLGMMAGGAAGAAVGAPEAGVGAIPGAMAGAAGGSIAGEGMRQATGKYLGTYDGDASDSARDMATEGLVGGLTEGAGRAVAPVVEPYVKAGLDSAGKLIKSGVSNASSLMTGVPKEAIERLIERPSQVLGADAEGKALSVAQSARQELQDRNQSETAAIQAARQKFRDQFGEQVVDTNPILEQHHDFMGKNAPGSTGLGPLSDDEADQLTNLEKRGVATEVRATPLENIKSNFGLPQKQKFNAAMPRTEPGTFANESKFSNLEDMGNELTQRNQRAARADLDASNQTGFNPYKPYETQVQSVEPPTLQFGKSGSMVVDTLPQKSAGDLQKFGDYLGNEVSRFDQSKLPGAGDTRFQSYLRSLYHQVKCALHTMDPEGLAQADKQFSEYAQNAGRLGRLDNPDQMEGFINNFYGKNKTLMRQSADQLIPQSVGDIADMGANRAFTAQGPAGSEMGRRSIGGALAGLGVYEGTHNPVLAGATAVSTSPQVHKFFIGRSSQAIEAITSAPWFQQIAKNPVLLDSIANPELKDLVSKLLGNGNGGMIPATANNGGPQRGVSGQ